MPPGWNRVNWAAKHLVGALAPLTPLTPPPPVPASLLTKMVFRFKFQGLAEPGWVTCEPLTSPIFGPDITKTFIFTWPSITILALPNSLTIHRVWILNVVIIISAPTSRRDMNERSSNSVSLKEKSHLMKLGLQCNLKSRKFLWKQRQRLPIMPKAKMPRHRTKVHFHNNLPDDVPFHSRLPRKRLE